MSTERVGSYYAFQAQRNKFYKNAGSCIAKSYEKQKMDRYQRWQYSYSLQVCQQFAVMGSAEDRMIDFIENIKTTPYYKQEVKRAVTKLNPYYVEKWHNDFAIADCESLMNAMIDCSVDSLKKTITQFYYAIKQAMDKDRLEDSAIKAEVYLIMMLIDISCYIYDLHAKIGPLPKDMTDEQREIVGQLMLDYSRHKLINSPYYDADYSNWIKGLRSTANQKAFKIIFDKIIGNWRHKPGGTIGMCQKIIINRVNSEEWINKIALDGLIDCGNYDEEMAALGRMKSVGDGDISITLDLLDSVRMYLHGCSDEEIKKEILRINPNAVFMPEQLQRNMDIIKLMRLFDSEPEAQKMFNELEEAWQQGGRDEAEKIHLQRMKMLENPAEYKEQPKPEPTEEDDMISKFMSKFGKVSKFKEKKHVEKKPVQEPLQLTNEPPSPRKHSKRWSPEEEEWLINHWYDEGMTATKVSAILKYRTMMAVRQKVYQLRMKGRLKRKNKKYERAK